MARFTKKLRRDYIFYYFFVIGLTALIVAWYVLAINNAMQGGL